MPIAADISSVMAILKSTLPIPISLDQAVRSGKLTDGMKIVMVGFGAGLTYGGTYCTWPNL